MSILFAISPSKRSVKVGVRNLLEGTVYIFNFKFSMTEDLTSMKNGEMKFIPSDFEPIPNTDHIFTPSKVWGRVLKREALSLYARYFERKGLFSGVIGVAPLDDIYTIHKDSSPGKKYKDQHLKDNEFARVFTNYAALFQDQLRKNQTPNTVITDRVVVPNDHDAVYVNENVDKLKDS